MLEGLQEAQEDETTARDALTDHMSSTRPSKGKARLTWDKKKDKLVTALEDARDKVHDMKAMQRRFN